MKRAYVWAAVFTILALGLSALILFGLSMPREVRVTLALGVSITLLYTGAAIAFLLALKGYKYRLRVAYRYICTSMFLVSLGTLQFVFIGAFHALDTPWVTLGGAGLPFALMITLAYLGIRIFARLVEVESALANTRVGLGTALGGGILTLVIAGLIEPSQVLFDIPMAMNAYGATALVVTAILVTKIRQITGSLYSSALVWSTAYYLILAVAGAAAIVSKPLLPANHWYNIYNVGTLPYFIGGLCVMAAALYFNRIAYAEKIKLPANIGANQHSIAPVDAIGFLAGFVSNKARIDPTLDRMRAITASIGPDKHLTDEQQDTLADVYLELEEFLVNSEAVRQYKQSDLRQMIELRFPRMVSERFWQSVQANHKAILPAG